MKCLKQQRRGKTNRDEKNGVVEKKTPKKNTCMHVFSLFRIPPSPESRNNAPPMEAVTLEKEEIVGEPFPLWKFLTDLPNVF